MNSILRIILMIPGMLIAFTFHEYAHALVADRLGDKTPRFQGRLNLNPITHIDPVGFIAVLLAGFGWAKPVQTNPSAYKNYYKDDLKVSLAGPMANVIISIVSALVLGLYVKFAYSVLPTTLYGVLFSMIFQTIVVNVNIGLFNLIPIPGLDGFSILRDLLPGKFYSFEEKFYRYQMPILLLFILFGGKIIAKPSGVIISWLQSLAMLILHIL